MISTSYRTQGLASGSLGIIGPTRLDYAKLMPLVGFTAQVVGDILDGRGQPTKRNEHEADDDG